MHRSRLVIFLFIALLGIPSTLRSEDIVSASELIVYLGISTVQNDKLSGVLASRINAGSPAEVAGIREGDYITKYNDKNISDVQSLVSAQEESKEKVLSGDLIICAIQRDSEILEIKVPMILVHKKSLVNLLKMSKEKQK